MLAAGLWWLRGDRAVAHRTACRAGVVLGWLLVALTARDHVLVLDPASPLADAAPALSAGGSRLVVVAIDGHVSGVVSASDLVRAVDLAPFRSPPDRPADVSTLNRRFGATRP